MMKTKPARHSSHILWKVYFWVYVCFAAISIITVLTDSKYSLLDYVDLVVSLPSILLVYGWAWGKKLGKRQDWAVYAVAFLGLDLYYNIHLSAGKPFDLSVVVGLLLALPGYMLTVLYPWQWDMVRSAPAKPRGQAGQDKPIVGYVLGGIAFLPAVGIPFGVAAVVIGIIQKQRGPIILGALGMLLSGAVYGALFYFGFVADFGPYVNLRKQVVQAELRQDQGELALYYQAHGRYPERLSDLADTPEAPIYSVDFWGRPLVYAASGGGQAYALSSAGADGLPGTADDISVMSDDNQSSASAQDLPATDDAVDCVTDQRITKRITSSLLAAVVRSVNTRTRTLVTVNGETTNYSYWSAAPAVYDRSCHAVSLQDIHAGDSVHLFYEQNPKGPAYGDVLMIIRQL